MGVARGPAVADRDAFFMEMNAHWAYVVRASHAGSSRRKTVDKDSEPAPRLKPSALTGCL